MRPGVVQVAGFVDRQFGKDIDRIVRAKVGDLESLPGASAIDRLRDPERKRRPGADSRNDRRRPDERDVDVV